MTISFRTLTEDSWNALIEDYKSFVDVAELLTTHQLGQLTGSVKRAERLKRWVSVHGRVTPRKPDSPKERTGKRKPRIIMVGDTHAEHGQDFRRFRWLGHLCNEFLTEEDDEVIWFGDHYNLDALYHKASNREKENKRFALEKAAGDEARAEFDEATMFSPFRRTCLEGNHCARVEGIFEREPFWIGAFDLWEGWEQAGWNVVPFDGGHGQYITHGWRCQHHFPGRSGRATGSVSGNSRAVLEKVVRHSESVAFGHTHEYDSWIVRNRTGRVRGLNVGWFGGGYEDYAGPDSNARWWLGVLLLHEVENGNADVEEWSFERLKNRYG